MGKNDVNNDVLINAVEALKAKRIVKKDKDITDALGFSHVVLSNYLANRVTASKNFMKCFYQKYGADLEQSVPKDYAVAEESAKYGKSNATPVNMADKQNLYVPLVSQRAYAGYLSGYSDEEYIEELPKEPFFMDREYKGKYLAFEVRGDSMDDGTRSSICDRDIVLGREIMRDHWKNKLHIHKWNFVIVTKEDGIIYKQITRHDTERGVITIHSLNPIYADREMKLADIAQLFNVVQVNRKL